MRRPRFWLPELALDQSALIRVGSEWWYFRDPVEVRAAAEQSDVPEVLDWAGSSEGWSVGYVRYEASPAFDGALHAHLSGDILARFSRFRNPDVFDEIAAPSIDAPQLLMDFGLSSNEYAEVFERIHSAISAGRTYQVNFSFRLAGEFNSGHSRTQIADFFCLCCQAGPPPFAALLFEDESAILSLSPELFFKRSGHLITCEPMKGTRPPDQAQSLQVSEKDRAENVMIVDMIRNDLGKIAQAGSVQVQSLFDVKSFSTVSQMTSTITANVPEFDLGKSFAALFPCASVTGAPKVEATKIIFEEEESARGVYCGAIGIVNSSEEFAQFNVGIRTLEFKPDGSATYSVGSGLVFDSNVQEEWEECLIKARAIQPETDWGLFETMLLERGHYLLLEDHLERLRASSAELGVQVDLEAVRRGLKVVRDSAPKGQFRVRVTCRKSGKLEVTHQPLVPQKVPVRAQVCPFPVQSGQVWLMHKTTRRGLYDRAMAAAPQVDDVLLWNEQGELCEFTRGNVAVKKDGEWLTPPTSSGCLPGVQRKQLLSQGSLREEVLYLGDLQHSDEILHINSLYGARAVSLDKKSLAEIFSVWNA